MPDWYINAARALAPWNYAFKFPDPPQGPRGQLLSADSFKLAVATIVSLAAAAFALFGRDLFAARTAVAGFPETRAPASGLAPPQRAVDEDGAPPDVHDPQ
jgi:hypothetical protein